MREIVELAARVAELERRAQNMLRHGTVAEVDAGKGLMRMQIGEGDDGQPFLSPWVPYGQIAGALKVHTPPSVGQQMTMISPTGDFRQAVAMPMTWSNQNASPSQSGSEHVLTFGSVKVEIRGNEVVVTTPKMKVVAGGSTFDLTGDGLDLIAQSVSVEGQRMEHNGLNVGHDHKHRDVTPGGGLTGIPVA